MRCEEKEKKSKTGVPYGFPEMGNICKKQIVSRGKVTNRARAGRGRRAGVSVRRPAGACLHRLMMSPSRGSPTCTGVCWDCDQCGIREVVKIYMKMHKSSHKCSNVNREKGHDCLALCTWCTVVENWAFFLQIFPKFPYLKKKWGVQN